MPTGMSPHERAKAFASAAWVALSDRLARPGEIAILKDIQAAFDLDDGTVALLIKSA